MKLKYIILACLCLGVALFATSVSGTESANALPRPEDSACVECHDDMNPGIVEQFRASKHGASGLDCSICHGSEHTGPDNADMAAMPTLETCQMCHPG